MPELRLAPATVADLPGVARVHGCAFTDSAITALGPEAVRRYYLWLLEGPHDATLVAAWQDEHIVGFCAAGVFRGAMNGFLRANRLYLSRHLATHPRLWWSPIVRDRVREALRITARFSRFAQQRPAAGPRPFGVLAIATDPAVHGTGVGRALMLDAEERARRSGQHRMVLTVHPENARAVRFYERLGWTRHSPPGTPWSGEMERTLT